MSGCSPMVHGGDTTPSISLAPSLQRSVPAAKSSPGPCGAWGTLPTADPHTLTEVAGADRQEYLRVTAGPAWGCEEREERAQEQRQAGLCTRVLTDPPSAWPPTPALILQESRHQQQCLLRVSVASACRLGAEGREPQAPCIAQDGPVPHEQPLDSHEIALPCPSPVQTSGAQQSPIPHPGLRIHTPNCQGCPFTHRLLPRVPPAP